MGENPEQEENVVQYQFKIDSDLWADWKDTVPRSKAVYERITELVEEDLEAHQ